MSSETTDCSSHLIAASQSTLVSPVGRITTVPCKACPNMTDTYLIPESAAVATLFQPLSVLHVTGEGDQVAVKLSYPCLKK